MTLRPRVLVYLAAVLACVPGFGWAQADALRHDPFTRPTFLKVPPPRAAPPRDGAAVGRAALPEPAWKPELAAVMLAGPKSAVSIDGTLVRIGDEINGHRLIEVRDQTAVFVKNGKRVTLSLRGTQPAPVAPPATKEERGKPAEHADQAGTATLGR
jgi:hypothetical protein